MFGLPESRTVVRTLEDLAVKVNSRFKSRSVVGTFPNARVGGEIEAAPLRQLLQLVFVHFETQLALLH